MRYSGISLQCIGNFIGILLLGHLLPSVRQLKISPKKIDFFRLAMLLELFRIYHHTFVCRFPFIYWHFRPCYWSARSVEIGWLPVFLTHKAPPQDFLQSFFGPSLFRSIPDAELVQDTLALGCSTGLFPQFTWVRKGVSWSARRTKH
jgi:hypothetical protein